MIGALSRKARQVMADPALRRYLLERLSGRIKPPPPFTPGYPPYLQSLALTVPASLPPLPVFDSPPPASSLAVDLPGAQIRLDPTDPGHLFELSFPDIETKLAVHRFAWLPIQGVSVAPGWVAALWKEWLRRHGQPGDGWEWHPYTAAERVINLLDYFGKAGGFPSPASDSLMALAAHGPAILARLEYFGDHYTGNHLSNNGRGLHALGCALHWAECADLGAQILLAEADRLFAPSGMLREGSAHYHLLLTRNYISAWLAARRLGRPETEDLGRIAGRCLAAARHLDLPGGLPLVGDISPDCPPSFLSGLLPSGTGGWVDGLTPQDAAAVAQLERPSLPDPLADGWARLDHGDWSLLVHASPAGWPLMPGHGHHDLGGFELHWKGLPLFVDPGRGEYGETGEAAHYRSAYVHNGLMLDDTDPTPPNRPYYDDSFRVRAGGAPPALSVTPDRIILDHHGFKRQGATSCRRSWTFGPSGLLVDDDIAGRGTHAIQRSLITTWATRQTPGGIAIDTPKGLIQVSCPSAARLEPMKRWEAYGRAVPATRIVFEERSGLPFTGFFSVEAV